MSILLDRDSRVAVLGITGRLGKFSAKDLLDYGTKVVAGVSPGRSGSDVEGVPVFANLTEAARETAVNAAIVYVPAPLALDAVLEAFDRGIKLVAYPGDNLPVADAMEMRAAARANGGWLVGPNSPGIISPGEAKLGFMPSYCFTPGSVGVISRSGSLSYEASYRLSAAGFGQTTVIGIGGDPVKGVRAGEAIAMFHDDPATTAVVYLGEIGGADEYAIAEYAKRPDAKPVAALLVGRTAPPGKKMGHAAALIGSVADTWVAKVEALEAAGVDVARSIDALVGATGKALARVGVAAHATA